MKLHKLFIVIFIFDTLIYASAHKVKGIYLNFYSTKGERFQDSLTILKKTKINSLVIDIKNEYGKIIYKSPYVEKTLEDANKKSLYKDILELVSKFKEHNIYLIARIVVFKDNLYATNFPDSSIKLNSIPYTKKDKMKWIDPNDTKYWSYVVNIAEEVIKAGFDEVQFDYVRFPASTSELFYPKKKDQLSKSDVINKFILYVKNKLKKHRKPLSIDVFGLVGNVHDDLSIGQTWEKISPHISYISPMMYPSHYPNNFANIKHPDISPYKTIVKSLKRSIKRNNLLNKPAIIRPWIQGFTAKWLKQYKKYGVKELQEQIRALKEHGIDEYLIWNPGSRYNKFFNLN